MPYKVTVICNETGEERVISMPEDWSETADYTWAEGNFSCDCNRALLFARSLGLDDPNIECGDSRYSVPRATLPDGSTVEIDG